jgi:hypothetical protein
MSGFPESSHQKSLFDHFADARPFARRLHLHLPVQPFAFGGAAASGGRTLSRAGIDSRPPTVYLFFVCFCRPTDRLPSGDAPD